VIEIENTLVSDILFERKFVCNLSACKGACCVQGDGGAPLEKDEKEYLEKNIDKIKPYLRKEGISTIEKLGASLVDKDGDDVTPLVDNQECAYTVFEADGTAKCGIENAHAAGAVDLIKPISCHLYPIRITKVGNYDALNYSKWEICDPACELGKAKNVKVYQFLKSPITRKYGEAYFSTLEEVDKALNSIKK
jgi:hypothetical protein